METKCAEMKMTYENRVVLNGKFLHDAWILNATKNFLN